MATLLPFKSPKRKRDVSESECYSPSASPPSTISITSLQEARLREEEDLGRYSPRTAVAGRLRELAIRGDYVSKSALGTADLIDDIREKPPQLDDQLDAPGDAEMPAPSPSTESDQGPSEQSTKPESRGTESELTPPALPTRITTTPSPRRKRTSSQPSKPRSRRRSPPLAGTAGQNALTWHDSEITGHHPNDPNDDGYGINGIGFRPTAAIAWARSQKRQKQVAEWKNREAREARERRRERREGMSRDSFHDLPGGGIQKRVKFDTDDSKD